MDRCRKFDIRLVLCAATALSAACLSSAARAQTAGPQLDQINQIESQIRALQNELGRVRRDMAARDAQLKAAQQDAAQAHQQAQAAQAQAQQTQAVVQTTQAAAAPQLPSGTFRAGGVTVSVGGFIAAEGLFRSRNETADIGSNWSTGIPLPQSPNYHTGEFRGSARQSRLSLLIQADAGPAVHLAGYYETDFLGVGTTSNSNESNSYALRLRQVYATLDEKDWGLHILGGQAWSLMTLGKVGIIPRQEDVPLTIDAQYVPGFNWARQWQVRAVKDFDDQKLWVGLSLEEPQTVYYTGPNGLVPSGPTLTINNAGGSLLNATTTYSDDVAPDVIAKVAYDPGFGHYELFGVARIENDRVSVLGAGHNADQLAGGVGGGAIIPLVPKLVDLQVSGMAGYGIGRYGSAQLPDAVVTRSGAPSPVPEWMALAGLITHPTPALDIYGYVGTEQESRDSFTAGGKGYGYGSPLYSNAGCNIELSTATCTANTSGVVQGTLGAWWRFLHGNYGTMEVGGQYSYTRRSTFAGLASTTGGTVSPSSDENIFLFSFRYLPFQ